MVKAAYSDVRSESRAYPGMQLRYSEGNWSYPSIIKLARILNPDFHYYRP